MTSSAVVDEQHHGGARVTDDGSDGPTAASAQLWAELSGRMRDARKKSTRSLRDVERSTGWGRGSLSQIETDKSKPTRAQVEWYDHEFGADGFLVSLFAEARGALGPGARAVPGARVIPGDDFEVVAGVAALGELVRPGSAVPVGWTLRNSGSVAWTGRQLRRVGAPAARGLVASAPRVALPDCEPGGTSRVRFEVGMPDLETTLMAAWEIVDGLGRRCFDGASLLQIVLVGHADA